MRTRLTKTAMGVNDSPTTMDAPHKNPEVSKYETGNPDSWNEGVNMDHPWDDENSKGREETGHPKMKTKGANTYASMVHEAKELEAKALRCLKLSETILPDAPADVIERQAVDFMTMSNKSVLSTLRRMREFDEIVSEARVAKIVDAVMEVIAEDKEEKKEEKKEEVEAKKAEKEEKVEEKVEEKKEATKEEKEDAEEEKKIATIVEAVLQALAEEEKVEEKKEEKVEEKKEAKEQTKEEKKEQFLENIGKGKEEKKEAKEEEKVEEKKEEVEAKKAEKEEKVEEKKEEVEAKKAEKEEEKKEEEGEEKEASLDVSFDEIGDVMASQEDVALLSQLFTAKEEEEKKEEVKEAKIKTLKNITASKEDEIDKLSSLWFKE